MAAMTIARATITDDDGSGTTGTIWNAAKLTQLYDAIDDLIVTVHSDSYTPTVSNTVNVAASTPAVTGYTRVGNRVTVSGTINIDPTTASPTETSFELSLPVASNLGAISDLGGTVVGVTETANILVAGAIRGNVANNTADVIFYPASTANQTLAFTFGYRVI